MGGNVSTAYKFPLGATINENEHILGISHGLFAEPKEDLTKQWNRFTGPTKDDNTAYKITEFHHKDFHRFGVANQLYFKLLNHLALLMMAISVLMLPQLVFASFGNMMQELNGSWMLNTMLGNFGTMPLMMGINDTEKLHRLMNRPMEVGAINMHVKTGVTIVACIDVVMLALCLGWAAFFYFKRMPEIVKRYDEKTLRMSDHAIIVFGIPADTDYSEVSEYEAMIRQHFEALSLENTDRGGASGNIVEDIFVFRDFDTHFSNFSKCGELAREFALIHARRQNGMKEKKCDKQLKKTRKKMVKTLGKVDKHWADERDRKPLVACVTFVHAADKDYVENIYTPYKDKYTNKNTPCHLMMKGEIIRVLQAPEPEAILWEHLDQPKWKKRGFTVLVWVISLLLIATYMMITWMMTMIPDNKIPPPLTTTHVAIMGKSTDSGWGFCDIELYSDFDCTAKINFVDGDVQPYWSQDRQEVTAAKATGDKRWPDQSSTCKRSSSAWLTTGSNDHLGKYHEGVVIALTSRSEVQCVKFNQAADKEYSSDTFIIQFCAEAGMGQTGDDKDNMADSEFSNFICTQASRLYMSKDNAPTEIMASTMFYYGESQTKESTMDCDDTNMKGATPAQITELVGLFDPMPGEKDPAFAEAEWFRQCICSTNTIQAFLGKKSDQCTDVNANNSAQTFKAVGLSLLVHVFNTLLKKTIRGMTVLEGHYSVNNLMMSSFTKLFICLYINQAVVMWFINIKWQTMEEAADESGLDLSGGYAEFNGLWYAHVGATMIATSISYIFLPHVAKIALVPLKLLIKRHKGKPAALVKFGGSYTQYDSNKAYTSPEFKIDVKAATVLALVGMTMFYGAGVPIMYPLTALAIVVIYWCDKFTFHGSRADKTLDEKVIKGCLYVVPVLVGTHAAMAMGFYGSPVTAPSYFLKPDMEDKVIATYLDELMGTPTIDPDAVKVISYWTPSGKGVMDIAWKDNKLPYIIFNSGAIVFFVVTVIFALATMGALIAFIVMSMGKVKSDKVSKNRSVGAEDDHCDGTTIHDIKRECRELGLVTTYSLDEDFPHYFATMTVLMTMQDRHSQGKSHDPEVVTKMVEHHVQDLWNRLQSRGGAHADHDAEFVKDGCSDAGSSGSAGSARSE